MPDADGLFIKECVKRAGGIKRIFFLTSHPELMQDAFGVKVAGFHIKPFEEEKLIKDVETNLQELKNDCIIDYKEGYIPRGSAA